MARLRAGARVWVSASRPRARIRARIRVRIRVRGSSAYLP